MCARVTLCKAAAGLASFWNKLLSLMQSTAADQAGRLPPMVSWNGLTWKGHLKAIQSRSPAMGRVTSH